MTIWNAAFNRWDYEPDDDIDEEPPEFCQSCFYFRWREACRHCSGDGFEPNTNDEPCTDCAGAGEKIVCNCNRLYEDWEI